MADNRPLSREDRLRNAQFIQTVIDYRNGRLNRVKAVNRMSYFSGLLPTLTDGMLSALERVSIADVEGHRTVITMPSTIIQQRRAALPVHPLRPGWTFPRRGKPAK